MGYLEQTTLDIIYKPFGMRSASVSQLITVYTSTPFLKLVGSNRFDSTTYVLTFHLSAQAPEAERSLVSYVFCTAPQYLL